MAVLYFSTCLLILVVDLLTKFKTGIQCLRVNKNMNKIFSAVLLVFLLAACSANTFDFPVENKTSLTSIECKPWIQTGSNLYKSTCLVDNLNGNEKRPLKLVAYNETGREIASAYIGKLTIGEKIKVNKAMSFGDETLPAMLVLEIAN